MFLDEIKIEVHSGKGGSGCVSLHREKFLPKGGPDGGDGGDGGGVFFRVKEGSNTLYHLKYRRLYQAKNGLPGEGKKCHGRNGADLILDVPPGTVIRDADTDELIIDFEPGITEWKVLDGGIGGKGNTHFKSSVHQTPRKFEFGREGKCLNLKLSLKSIADVGFVGLPNAGKSSLLSRISNAQPKVAAYPFTTLTPNLGTHVFDHVYQVVFADIPGLIEGAAGGKGLGIDFLKHVERTKLILHLADPLADNDKSPPENIRLIREELAAHSEALAAKPEILVLSKCDLGPDEDDIAEWEKELGQKFIQISTVTGEGVDNLLRETVSRLRLMEEEEEDNESRNSG